nr:hypothetical protein Itr_chr11CG14160 [Ipomoea trifida]GLL39584.1 hypothetical protein Itr_chr11CG14170 [Ipomoea trifida]
MDLRLLPGGPSGPVREAAPVVCFPGLHRSPRCSSMDDVEDGKLGAAASLVSRESSGSGAPQRGGLARRRSPFEEAFGGGALRRRA